MVINAQVFNREFKLQVLREIEAGNTGSVAREHHCLMAQDWLTRIVPTPSAYSVIEGVRK